MKKIRQILGALTTCALLALAGGAPASERDATLAVEKREAARKAAGPAAAQARGRLARRSGELPESVRAATGGADARAPRGATPTGTTMVATPAGATPTVATPAGQPNLAAATRAVPAAAPRLVIPRDSVIGGPHVQGQGRVGGPATGRTTHGGTIDGTQLRHKS